jgi:topoisomerase-4 subunit B
LLFLIFYKLAPELIRNGHIYIAETPRFKINFTDGTYIYVKDDAERDKTIKEQGHRITKISRYKGLGEVNASDLRETTIAPATRNLIQLDCDFDNITERDLNDALFGADKYGQRKELIAIMLKCDIADIEDFDLELEDDDEEEEENED